MSKWFAFSCFRKKKENWTCLRKRMTCHYCAEEWKRRHKDMEILKMAAEIVITMPKASSMNVFCQGLFAQTKSIHRVLCSERASDTHAYFKKIEQMTSRFGHKSTEKFIRCHTRSISPSTFDVCVYGSFLFFSIQVETNKNGQSKRRRKKRYTEAKTND